MNYSDDQETSPVADLEERQSKLEILRRMTEEEQDGEVTNETPAEKPPRPPEAEEFHAPETGPERAEAPEEAGVGG